MCARIVAMCAVLTYVTKSSELNYVGRVIDLRKDYQYTFISSRMKYSISITGMKDMQARSELNSYRVVPKSLTEIFNR